MLASERSSPVAAASIEKPPQTPGSSSQKAVEETAIISADELAVPEDLPPDGGLRAWLVVFGARSRIWIPHCTLTSFLSAGRLRHGCHGWDRYLLGGKCDCILGTTQTHELTCTTHRRGRHTTKITRCKRHHLPICELSAQISELPRRLDMRCRAWIGSVQVRVLASQSPGGI